MKEWDFVAAFAYAVLILYSLIIIYLLFFAVITALKNNYDFTNDHNIFGLPNVGKYALSLENFQNAVEYMKIQIRGREYAGVFAQFIYALMYAFGCTIANVFSKVFAAYFCSKFKTKFGRILYVVSVVAMILPVVGTMASTIRIMRLLNIYNTYQGIVLYNASFWGPYFLVFYAAFKGIPDTYAEAARMDGAGHFMIFFRIIFPSLRPRSLPLPFCSLSCSGMIIRRRWCIWKVCRRSLTACIVFPQHRTRTTHRLCFRRRCLSVSRLSFCLFSLKI